MADCSDDVEQKARGQAEDFGHDLGRYDLRHREVALGGVRAIFTWPLVSLDFDDTVCLERPQSVPNEQVGHLARGLRMGAGVAGRSVGGSPAPQEKEE